MATLTQRKPKKPKHNGTRLYNAAPQGDCICKARLGRPQKPHIWEQQLDVIQGRGHDITRPCTLVWNIWNSDSDVLNYNHMHHNRRLPLSEHHRNPHHMPVQCANRSYLHFTALHQLNEVSKKDVSVPLTETICIVGHLEERQTEGFLKSHNYERGRVFDTSNKMKDDTCVKNKKLGLIFWLKSMAWILWERKWRVADPTFTPP